MKANVGAVGACLGCSCMNEDSSSTSAVFEPKLSHEAYMQSDGCADNTCRADVHPDWLRAGSRTQTQRETSQQVHHIQDNFARTNLHMMWQHGGFCICLHHMLGT